MTPEVCGLKGCDPGTPTHAAIFIQTKGDEFAGFHWRSGHGAFSVSQPDSDAVIACIRNQPEHHKKVSFQEEYRRFLERYNVAYDERYVWD
jgi:putative transposase